jgi:hypothetical protein
MIVSIVILLLSLAIGVINFAPLKRGEKRKTLSYWAKSAIALSFILCVFSVWKLVEDSQRDANAPFFLTEADIQPQLFAFLVNVEPSAVLDPKPPTSINLDLVIPSEGQWTCFLEGMGFASAGHSHGPPTSGETYITKQCKKSENLKVRYAWDLVGKTVQVRNPIPDFSDVTIGGVSRQWQSTLTIRIEQKDFKPADPSAATLLFSFDGLQRDRLLKSRG